MPAVDHLDRVSRPREPEGGRERDRDSYALPMRQETI